MDRIEARLDALAATGMRHLLGQDSQSQGVILNRGTRVGGYSP
jgi:hypothetical protein